MLDQLDLFLNIYAAIEFRPQIAGVLTVLVSVLVLCGSVWLLLVTNSGIRLGTLVSLAGFFGWMFIMGITWWIYGIGYAGSSPVWVTNDINRGDLGVSALPAAQELSSIENLDFTAFDLVATGGDEEATKEYNRTLNLVDSVDIDDVILADAVNAQFGNTLFENLSLEQQTQVQQRARELTLASLSDADRAQLEEDFNDFVADQTLRNETVTFSELAAVAPGLTDEANFGGIGDWRLVSSAGAGEAQAQASADVIEAGVFDSAAEFKFLDTYARGGKPKRASNGMWDRVTNKISTTINIRHPEHNTVVRLQQVKAQTPAPGEAPPRPVVDEAQPVVNVVMTRDLGNRRFPPALVTVGSLLIFLALCYLLHVRDVDATQRREAFEADPKGEAAKASV